MKPQPKALNGKALNESEIELAASPLKDVLVAYNGVEWWVGFRPIKVLADSIEEMEMVRMDRLSKVGIDTSNVSDKDEFLKGLSEQQAVQLLQTEKGMRPYEVKAYVPAIEDWNLPEKLELSVEAFLSNGGIYDAVLAAVIEAYNPTSGGATEEEAPTNTPSLADGGMPSTAGETERQTAASGTSLAGPSISPSPKSTERKTRA